MSHDKKQFAQTHLRVHVPINTYAPMQVKINKNVLKNGDLLTIFVKITSKILNKTNKFRHVIYRQEF